MQVSTAALFMSSVVMLCLGGNVPQISSSSCGFCMGPVPSSLTLPWRGTALIFNLPFLVYFTAFASLGSRPVLLKWEWPGRVCFHPFCGGGRFPLCLLCTGDSLCCFNPKPTFPISPHPLGTILKRWKKNWFDLWSDGHLIYYDDQTRQSIEDKVHMPVDCINIRMGHECRGKQCPELPCFPSLMSLFQYQTGLCPGSRSGAWALHHEHHDKWIFF